MTAKRKPRRAPAKTKQKTRPVGKLIDKMKGLSADEHVKLLMDENTKLRKRLEKSDHGSEIFESVLRSVYSAPSNLSPVKIPAPSKKKRNESFVFHLTDWHFAKLTKTYDCAIAERRLAQCLSAIEEIASIRRVTAGINELVLLLGGDMIEGQEIFPGQAYALDAGLVKQCLKEGPELMANAIRRLGSTFPKLRVVAVPGNHGRVNKNGSSEFNSDSVFYEVTRMLVTISDPGLAERITWDLPLDRDPGDQWFAHTIVQGHGCTLVHGDTKGGGNQLGYPWYSIGRRVGGYVSVMPPFKYFFIGHNHQWATFEPAGKMVLATGSMESDNSYAAKNFAGAGDPHQRLCVFNDRLGLISDIRLHLD